MIVIFKQFFRLQRSGLLTWMSINGFWGWALGTSVKSMDKNGTLTAFMAKAIQKLPSAVQTLFGMAPNLSPLDNLMQSKLGVWMAIALPMYGCLIAASAVAREIDTGTADFLFSLPVKRHSVLAARWAVLAVNLSIVAVSTWAGLYLGMAMGGVSGNFRGYFWMIAQSVFVSLAVGSIALAASMYAPDYERAMKRSLAGVGALFTVNIAMEMASAPKIIRAFNPYTYFDTLVPLLRGEPAWKDIAALAAMSLLALCFSVWTFRSRQFER